MADKIDPTPTPRPPPDATWEDARMHVLAEQRRLAQCVHDLRRDVFASGLRIAVIEAKMAIIGVACGSLGTALAHFLFGK